MKKTWKWIGLLAVLAVMAGCGESASGDSTSSVRVVASTNGYGDIVRQLTAGAKAPISVTSIISDPSQDPHSYEADTQNALALSKADLVIENGGGYDDFVDKLLATSGGKAKVLNAYEISGHAAGGNEHVWYDFPTVAKVVARITAALSSTDPADKATFTANAATFTSKLKALEATEATIKSQASGEGIAITEPVPVYLLEAAGLTDKTPAAFSEAIEEGTDVPAGVLRTTLKLFSDHSVRALVYNAQTSGPETTAVVAAAKTAGIPAVPVTETLPAGQNYLSWMTSNLAAVKASVH